MRMYSHKADDVLRIWYVCGLNSKEPNLPRNTTTGYKSFYGEIDENANFYYEEIPIISYPGVRVFMITVQFLNFSFLLFFSLDFSYR